MTILFEYDFTDVDEDAKPDVALARVFVDSSFRITRLDTHALCRKPLPNGTCGTLTNAELSPTNAVSLPTQLLIDSFCHGFRYNY